MYNLHISAQTNYLIFVGQLFPCFQGSVETDFQTEDVWLHRLQTSTS